MNLNLFYSCVLFSALHTLVWFSANSQFISDEWKAKSMMIMLLVAVPISACAYYATRLAYEPLGESVWGARFLGFGVSYLVFPILTYVLLGESMFTTKTMLCVILSFLIIGIQIWL